MQPVHATNWRYPENMSIGQVIEMIKKHTIFWKRARWGLIARIQIKVVVPQKNEHLSGGTTQKVSATLAFFI